MPDPLAAAFRHAPSPLGAASVPANVQGLRAAAQGLESGFLSVMLQAAGLGAARESMGGGIGEAQFASFLAEAQAEAMVQRGGIGLAEAIFESLKARGHDLG
jgi:Rod binding domain-containing protein